MLMLKSLWSGMTMRRATHLILSRGTEQLFCSTQPKSKSARRRRWGKEVRRTRSLKVGGKPWFFAWKLDVKSCWSAQHPHQQVVWTLDNICLHINSKRSKTTMYTNKLILHQRLITQPVEKQRKTSKVFSIWSDSLRNFYCWGDPSPDYT